MKFLKPSISETTRHNHSYPFGMVMPGREYTGGEYKFGFNGKGYDWELNFNDYKNRIYSPRLNRFISIDPRSDEYSYNSPFGFAENTPIWAIDLDGLEKFRVTYYADVNQNITKREITYVKKKDRSYKQKYQVLLYYSAKGDKKELLAINKRANKIPSFTFEWKATTQVTINGKPLEKALEDGDISNYLCRPVFSSSFKFELDKPVPTPDHLSKSQTELKIMSEYLKANPGIKIEIIGHTSSEPSSYTNESNPEGFRSGNEALSYDRAKYVNDKLLELGVPSGQLEYTGVASNSPLKDIPTIDASQRRIEYKITEDKVVIKR